MATKEQLIENIKARMRIDNEIKQLQKELKQRRTEKILSDSLVAIMKDNEID